MGDLIVIRGNSGSGKSTVAGVLRRRMGRGTALVEQDYLRRVLLREHGDTPDPLAPDLIDLNARFALKSGYHVIVEGILGSNKYGEMLRKLIHDHDGRAFYLDVTWLETVRRHGMRPQAATFTVDQMREWFRERDLLGVPKEVLISESSSLDETVAVIERSR